MTQLPALLLPTAAGEYGCDRKKIRLLLLNGVLAALLPTAAEEAKRKPDCWAHSEDKCLHQSGCRWFSYSRRGEKSCPLCEAVFGKQDNVTGCRDWDPAVFCHEIIFKPTLEKYGGPASEAAFRQAVRMYEVAQGSGEVGNPHNKRATCDVWCDYSWPYACLGQPRSHQEVRGVNYGGRFVPERYLGTPGLDQLFAGISFPKQVDGKEVKDPSLCDVGEASDAMERMTRFLDTNIKQEHFEYMGHLGFNVLRLPVGYWNFAALPGASAPNGADGKRWRKLQYIMPPLQYLPWIENVFKWAKLANMSVLLDLHGAPGGQTDNTFTGCDQGRGNFFFDTEWNMKIAVQAIEGMAKVCGMHRESCYGIELLNEPHGDIPRDHLEGFYLTAISHARRHLNKETPLVIMDWTSKLKWWHKRRPFSYKHHGRILFSTHLYHMGPEITDQNEARRRFRHEISLIKNFHLDSIYDVLVTEYAVSGHGPGNPETDLFDYNSLANWYVHQFNKQGMGSVIWNFDADPSVRAWGPVQNGTRLGGASMTWKKILSGTPLRDTMGKGVREDSQDSNGEENAPVYGHVVPYNVPYLRRCRAGPIQCWLQDNSSFVAATACVFSMTSAAAAVLVALRGQVFRMNHCEDNWEEVEERYLPRTGEEFGDRYVPRGVDQPQRPGGYGESRPSSQHSDVQKTPLISNEQESAKTHSRITPVGNNNHPLESSKTQNRSTLVGEEFSKTQNRSTLDGDNNFPLDDDHAHVRITRALETG